MGTATSIQQRSNIAEKTDAASFTELGCQAAHAAIAELQSLEKELEWRYIPAPSHGKTRFLDASDKTVSYQRESLHFHDRQGYERPCRISRDVEESTKPLQLAALPADRVRKIESY